MMASKVSAYEIIRSKKVKLQEYLQAKSSEVLDHFYQTEIVLKNEYTTLKSENDPIARTRHLVDLVLDKGEDVCMRFLKDVLVPLRSEIPLLDQWISQHEQQLNVMGVDLRRTAGDSAFVVMASKDTAYEIIRTNKVKLQKYLQAKSSEVLDHLYQTEIVLKNEYTTLKSENDPIARTRHLVDLVLDKGEDVCMRILKDVLVPLRSEIPLLDQWISQHEQQLNVMGVDLRRTAGKAIPGAASRDSAFVVMASKDTAYEIIRTNKVKLQKYLQAKSSEVRDHSQQAGIVLHSEYASLKSENDPNVRTRDLVDLVLEKGEDVCMIFLKDVLVPLQSEIPLLHQWISQHKQQLNLMGVDLSRTAGEAIPGAASHNPGDDYREFLLKRTSLTQDYNARPGEPAVFLLERMVKPILVLYYRHQETKEHELLARGKQHEELMKRVQREGMTYKKLFDPIGKKTHPRLVIVVGIPGSGKTMLSKCIVHSLLSGERVFAQRFEHIVLIRFREINDIGEVSLAELFSVLHSCLGNKANEVFANQERTLFVMDGLDEFGKCLHYANACTDPQKTATVEAIIAALVNGNLLPKASVLITTRPIAMEQLSGVNVDRAVEISGFSNEDKIEFLCNFYQDRSLAERALKLLQENETVNTLSQNPSFCHIAAIILKENLQKSDHSEIILKSMTDLFTQYVFGLIKHHGRGSHGVKEIVSSLANMALKGVKQNIQIFSQKNLEECVVSSSELGSTFINKVFTCEGIKQGSCYSFSHLTMQEFFAAIAVHLSHSTWPVSHIIRAIENSKDGRFDVFQRFFCGLASSTPWKFFEGMLDPPSADSQKKIIMWLNRSIKTQKTDKHKLISLLHCVHELHDIKSLSDATWSMTKIELAFTRLSLPDCAAISWILLHQDKPVEILNLSGCGIGTEEMKRLQPGLHRCKELFLSLNKIGDSGLRLLADVMLGREGSLETLTLDECSLMDRSGSSLSVILKANTGLKRLRLSLNEIGDSGLRLLADGMLGREGSLETLDLLGCSLTDKSGSSLSVILKANTRLKSLVLRENKIGDSGLQLFADGMLGREGSLETLYLRECSLMDKSGSSLSVIIKANTGLKSLELCGNYIGDSGLRLLADGMLGSEGSLEKLYLQGCSLMDKSIPALHDIVITNKALRVLGLMDNDLSAEGKQELGSKWHHRRGMRIYV
ncbi:NACHT, LRR and PYD domains-containing protein 3-like isoform X3 [Lampetra planeri]